MKPIRMLAAALPLLFLLACGGQPAVPASPEAAVSPTPVETGAEAVVETPEPTPEPTPESTPEPTPESTPEPLLITNEMLDSGTFDGYFDDALFIGDSLTWTFSHYVRNVRNAGDPDYLGGAKFMGSVSMNTKRASDNTVVKDGINFEYRGKSVTLTEGIQKSGAKKIFLLLGLNDLRVRNWDDVLGYFAKIIETVQTECPGVKIVVQAVLPVRKTFYDREDPDWNSFNVGLKALCEESGVDFLSFAEEVMDENGEMRADLCGDGKCHLNIEGEEIWVRCLRRYAVMQTHENVVFETP